MADFTPHRGATLLIPSGGKLHLFVIVTDPSGRGEYLLISVSSIKEGRYYDATCEIDPGTHEFITLPSYGFYGDAQVMTEARLIQRVQSGAFIERADLPADIVERLCEGIEVSIHTPKFAKQFYRASKRG